MVAPRDDRPERAPAVGRGEVECPQVVVVHQRRPGVGDEALWGDRDLVDGEARRLEGGDRGGEHPRGGGQDLFPVKRIDAAAQGVRSPEAHQVGGRVIVGGRDDRVGEAELGREPAPDRDDVVVEQPDRVEHHAADAGVAVVDHPSDGLQVVVDRGRAAVLAEAGEVDRARGVAEVGIDLLAGEPGPEGARFRAGGGSVDGDPHGVARRTVAEGVGGAEDEGEGEQQQEGAEAAEEAYGPGAAGGRGGHRGRT